MKIGFAAGASFVLAGAGLAQVTVRVSVATNGSQGYRPSGIGASFGSRISADGRYVAFTSWASNLIPGDTNGVGDVFVRDIVAGTTERVSVAANGAQGTALSDEPSMTADGRFVAFASQSENFVAVDTNGVPDVFVRDRLNNTTERVSVATGGAQANGTSLEPSTSADGRYVAFLSYATNLVPGDTNGSPDIFVRDRLAGTTERVNVTSSGSQALGGNSISPSISADGRYVAFCSFCPNLVPSDTNGRWDIFVHDRRTGATERVSLSSSGAQGNGDSGFIQGGADPISISADGRFVGFASASTNLVPGFSSGLPEPYVRDRSNGTTDCVDVTPGGTRGNAGGADTSISDNGRFVAFCSWSDNLVPGDTNGYADVFLRDRLAGSTELISVATSGTQGNNTSYSPSITGDARFVEFGSNAGTLVPADTNGIPDAFVRDRAYSPYSSLCDPGAGSVLSCPCANPPSSLGRGCDNSFGTGGSILSASGIAFLSSDSLVFTTNGELPSALSILMQGSALLANGAIYGQGVRCVGGSLKRLFVKTAVAGSITAPDFGAGDPPVSIRSAATGDLIQPGESRYYLVYYRDPTVLGGCPASATFNATQTGQVTWWP